MLLCTQCLCTVIICNLTLSSPLFTLDPLNEPMISTLLPSLVERRSATKGTAGSQDAEEEGRKRKKAENSFF